MKKATLIIAIVLMAGMALQAQIKFGIRGGVSSSTIKVDEIIKNDLGDDLYEVIGSDAGVGFHAGVLLRVQVSSIYVQPELLFSSTGGEVQIEDLVNGGVSLKDQSFKKLDIPVTVGMKFGPARVGVGPVASYVIKSDSPIDELTGDVEQTFKSATFGYQAGVGLDIWKLALDLKYEGNLSKLGDGVNVAGYEATFDTRNPQWILSLGIFF
jgi:hypothetical protein